MNIKILKKGRKGYLSSDAEDNELPKKLTTVLYQKLAYEREGAEFMPNPQWAYVRLYNLHKRYFPWGLISQVDDIMSQWSKYSGDTYEIIDDTKIERSGYKSKILRPYQKDAVEALIENKGGIVCAPCGAGKTIMMLEFLKTIKNKKALIIVPSVFLKIQWEKDIKNLNIDVKTYQSIKEYKFMKEYDILIIDECHMTPAKTIYNTALKFGDGVVCGCSATPYRNYEPSSLMITAALGDIVYKISASELIKKGYLVDIDIEIIKIPHGNVQLWDEYQDVYVNHIVENEERNKKIIKIAKKESKKGLTFIAVERVEHGNILMEMLKDKNCVFIHGKVKERDAIFDDIKNGKFQIVVCTKVFDTGVNFTNLQTLIIGGGGKSAIKVIQVIGRAMRLHDGKERAKIYDFDDGVKYLKQHLDERKKIYEEFKDGYT